MDSGPGPQEASLDHSPESLAIDLHPCLPQTDLTQVIGNEEMTDTYAGKLRLARPWAPMERQHQLGNSVCVYYIERWWGVLADVSEVLC